MDTATATIPHPLHVTMIWIRCGACGVAYGMAQHVYDARQADGQAFYCTNGHARVYRVTEVDELKRKLAATEQSLQFTRADRDAAHARELKACRRESAQKANVTKLKRRAEAGVCAHCNRTFDNVARHMKTKHPHEAT